VKKILLINIIIFLFWGCFESPDITPPMFVPKSPPDSLVETGIDAHPDNAIYLEWEEPSTAEEEGILSYYIYRGSTQNGEVKFKYLDEVVRSSGVIYESDSYIDYDVTLDSTYYYYLRSHNDFTDSRETSDTASYNLSLKAFNFSPFGEINYNQPSFFFRYQYTSDRISHLYLRLFYFEETSYKIKYFTKTFINDFSKTKYYIYLNNNNYHTVILFDSLWTNSSNQKYLKKGNYRWRVDAIASELGGAPETEGSESEWVYFTVK